MLDRQHEERALSILFNMAVERKGFWNQIFRRWWINDEPLRNDAADLLREISYRKAMPENCQLVGDDNGGSNDAAE